MLLSVLRILSTASSITTRIQQGQSRNFDSEPAISLTRRCWVFKFSRGGICTCPVLLSVLAVSVPARSSSGNVIIPYPLKAFLVSQRKGKGLSGRRRGSAAREIRPAAEILIRSLSFRSTPKAPPVFRRGLSRFLSGFYPCSQLLQHEGKRLPEREPAAHGELHIRRAVHRDGVERLRRQIREDARPVPCVERCDHGIFARLAHLP